MLPDDQWVTAARLATDSGAGPMLWGQAVLAQIKRVRGARDALLAVGDIENPDEMRAAFPEAARRFQYEAHFLVVAIRNVVRYAEALAKALGRHDIAQALDRFDERVPQARAFRDYLTHLDEYLLGKGWHQDAKRVDAPIGLDASLSVTIDGDREAVLHFDRHSVSLDAAADAALELGYVTAQAFIEERESALGTGPPGPERP